MWVCVSVCVGVSMCGCESGGVGLCVFVRVRVHVCTHVCTHVCVLWLGFLNRCWSAGTYA